MSKGVKELEKINNCDEEVKSLSKEYKEYKIEINNKDRIMKTFNKLMDNLQKLYKKNLLHYIKNKLTS